MQGRLTARISSISLFRSADRACEDGGADANEGAAAAEAKDLAAELAPGGFWGVFGFGLPGLSTILPEEEVR